MVLNNTNFLRAIENGADAFLLARRAFIFHLGENLSGFSIMFKVLSPLEDRHVQIYFNMSIH